MRSGRFTARRYGASAGARPSWNGIAACRLSIVSAIMGDGLDPAARLNIHRNHYISSLGEALKATYPVACRLVDERFFAYAASEYIKISPPRRVCLFEYGEGFPDFLAAFPACASLVYLADVARLEWLINAALHATAQ